MDRLLATKSEGVGLVVHVISFQDFKSMWSQSTNVTDGQTDGRHAIPRPRICTKVHCAVKYLGLFHHTTGSRTTLKTVNKSRKSARTAQPSPGRQWPGRCAGSRVTWRHRTGDYLIDTLGAISYRYSIVTKSVSPPVFEIFSPKNVNERTRTNEPTNTTDRNTSWRRQRQVRVADNSHERQQRLALI